jgi:hypothetical protein
MDWIWSSRCLELLCISTQSSNLKWVSGGGINSQRHQTSRWLTTSEKVSVGWTDAMFFKASVHPMPLPRHLAVRFSDIIAPTLYTDSASVHPVLKTPRTSRLCMLLCDRRIDRCFLLTKASVHPVLKGSSWRISVWIQTECRIDRRCPHLDRRIIRCYSLRCSTSATRPKLLVNGPSVHPTVPRV